MNQLSITKRFKTLICGLCALALFIAAFGGYSVFSLNRAMKDLDKASRLNELAVDSMVEVKQMQNAMRGYLLNPGDESLMKKKEEADDKNVKIIAEMKTLTGDPELIKIFDEQSNFDDKELNPREAKLGEMLKAHKVEEARATYIKEVMPVQALYEELGSALAKKTDVAAEAAIADARTKIERLTLTLVIVSVLAIIALNIGAAWTVRAIVRALNGLVATLSRGADEVAATATELSSTSVELSSAATEQASSIQETASSVEEVNAMVKKNADNAAKSGQVAQRSQASANRGKGVVQEMIVAMDGIDTSNADIMGQIEQSNRQMAEIVKVIGDIGNKTKVINDIVFQTKLLSFNASVEAARAGEHGKGFAVVAEEVGNLAQMSGNAAKEISAMLEGSIRKVEDIVKDTKAKVEVLVAEGKAKVGAGTTIIRKTGAVLDEIVEGVTEVFQMVGEISTASHEQAQGVQEITKAVAQMDQVTQQNAAASHQASSAAEGLSKQAEVLRAGVRDLVALVGAETAEVSRDHKVIALKARKVPVEIDELPAENDERFKEA